MAIACLSMTADDLDEVIALWKCTDGVGLNESDSTTALRAFLERNPGLSLIARDSETLVAAVLCGYDGRRGFLYHLSVAQGYRRQGLGTLLVERCLQSLAAHGITKCNAFVYEHNEAGRQFWQRLGWQHRGDLIILQQATITPLGPMMKHGR